MRAARVHAAVFRGDKMPETTVPLMSKHINAFIEPAIAVLKQIAALEARVGVPRQQSVTLDAETILVVLGVRGDLTGTILFRFNLALARQILQHITGEQLTLDILDPRVKDALGELANIIVGNATGNLNRLGIRAAITPPIVATGISANLVFPNAKELIAIPLITEIGEFEMNVTFAVVMSNTQDKG
jgi:chemotaxis protein CheX